MIKVSGMCSNKINKIDLNDLSAKITPGSVVRTQGKKTAKLTTHASALRK